MLPENGQIHSLFVDYVKFVGLCSHTMKSQRDTNIKNVFRVIKLTLELEGLIIEQVILEIEIPTRFLGVKQNKNPASLKMPTTRCFKRYHPVFEGLQERVYIKRR